MFDTYHSKEYVPYEKNIVVTEKKAPTDESIRLYEEIKEKAYKSILDSFTINENNISFSVIAYRDKLCMEDVIQYKFILNGKEFVGKDKVGVYGLLSKEDVFRNIYASISQEIAEMLMTDLLKSNYRIGE